MPEQTDFDIREVIAGFGAMDKRATSRAAPYFREVAIDLRDHVRGHTKNPGGPWPGRAPGSKKNVRPMGKLRTANSTRADESGARVISKVPWSGVHEEGGKVNRGAEIPVRQTKWMSSEFQQKVADGFLAYVLEGFKRGATG